MTFVYEFSAAALADYHKFSSLNNTKLFLTVPQVRSPTWAKIKVLAWLHSLLRALGNLAYLGYWQTSYEK